MADCKKPGDCDGTFGKKPTGAEREYETGMDEFYKSTMGEKDSLLFANRKRTYDEYQQESLETIRMNRSYVAKTLSDASQNDNVRQNIANQALQNAVETANIVAKNTIETSNMIGKQAVRHGDIAIDREWNIDEVATLSAKNGVQADAMVALLAKIISAAADNE